VNDRERDVFEELAAAFPGSLMFWRDDNGELVVRGLDETGIDEALRPPASRDDAMSSFASEAAEQADDDQLGLFDNTEGSA